MERFSDFTCPRTGKPCPFPELCFGHRALPCQIAQARKPWLRPAAIAWGVFLVCEHIKDGEFTAALVVGLATLCFFLIAFSRRQ